MSTNKQSVCISFTGEQLATSEGMAALTAVGIAMAEAFDDDVAQIVRELNVSEKCAADIAYLRTRSRHTAQLEQRLIDMHVET